MTDKAEKILKVAQIYSIKTVGSKTYFTWAGTFRFVELEKPSSPTRETYFVDEFCKSEERRGQAMAGPGMYVAETPLASAEYGDADGRGLLQLTIPSSVPLYNAQDMNCTKLLRLDARKIDQEITAATKATKPNLVQLYTELKAKVNVNVTAQDVFSKEHIAPILVRHAGTWLCLKTSDNVVFKSYDGVGQPDKAKEIYNALLNGHKKAAENLKAQLDDNVRNAL